MRGRIFVGELVWGSLIPKVSPKNLSSVRLPDCYRVEIERFHLYLSCWKKIVMDDTSASIC